MNRRITRTVGLSRRCYGAVSKRFDFAPNRLKTGGRHVPRLSTHIAPARPAGIPPSAPVPYSPTSRSKPMTQTAEHTSSLEMASPSEPAAVPALEVHEPAQGVHPSRRQAPGLAPPAPPRARAEGRLLRDRDGRVLAILGQNGSGQVDAGPAARRRCSCTTAGARTSSATTCSRNPARCGGWSTACRSRLLLQEDVRAREPELRRALLRAATARTPGAGSRRS